MGLVGRSDGDFDKVDNNLEGSPLLDKLRNIEDRYRFAKISDETRYKVNASIEAAVIEHLKHTHLCKNDLTLLARAVSSSITIS